MHSETKGRPTFVSQKETTPSFTMMTEPSSLPDRGAFGMDFDEFEFEHGADFDLEPRYDEAIGMAYADGSAPSKSPKSQGRCIQPCFLWPTTAAFGIQI